jgi:Ca-activated chloride channel homolog
MDPQTNQFTPDQLYDQALALFRSARWDEAVATLRQLQAQGGSTYPEADILLADIQMKQGIERRAQEPTAAAPPRERKRRSPWIGVTAVAVVLLGLIGGLRVLITGSQSLSDSLPMSQQALTGSLPTPAPSTVAGAGAPAGGKGVLKVKQANTATTVKNIYFILDASGSMLAKIDGQRKIDLAHQAFSSLVQELDDQTNVALRTYGRNRANDCNDVELLNKMAPLNRTNLLAEINGIIPVNESRTPIGSSLAAISTDLGQKPDETLVVLMSDGEESCNGDPVAEATRLHKDNPQVRVSVVGFDIAPESQARLAAIAEAGGGNYFGAADVNQLGAALKQAISLEYRVVDKDGKLVNKANVGEVLTLPVGNYRILIGGDPPLLEQPIDIREGLATVISLSSENGQFSAKLSRDWAP